MYLNCILKSRNPRNSYLVRSDYFSSRTKLEAIRYIYNCRELSNYHNEINLILSKEQPQRNVWVDIYRRWVLNRDERVEYGDYFLGVYYVGVFDRKWTIELNNLISTIVH